MDSLKGCHVPKDAVLYAVFFYLRYTVSYHYLEEIMTERGVAGQTYPAISTDTRYY